jgi:hypothetical protein
MYPSRELKVLAERRAYLQLRIEARREECIEAGHGVAEGVERLLLWTRLLKAGGLVGAIGSGLLSLRRRRGDRAEDEDGDEDAPEEKSWGAKALRWAPVALRAVRIISSFV